MGVLNVEASRMGSLSVVHLEASGMVVVEAYRQDVNAVRQRVPALVVLDFVFETSRMVVVEVSRQDVVEARLKAPNVSVCQLEASQSIVARAIVSVLEVSRVMVVQPEASRMALLQIEVPLMAGTLGVFRLEASQCEQQALTRQLLHPHNKCRQPVLAFGRHLVRRIHGSGFWFSIRILSWFRYRPLCYCVGVVVHKSCGDTDGVLPDVCGAKGGCRACVKIVIPWCGNL